MGRSTGFTLIELMVAIAVFAIVTLIAVPGFGRFFEVNRVHTQTNEVVTALNAARSEAIRRAEAVSVITSTSDEGPILCLSLDGDDCDTDPNQNGGDGMPVFLLNPSVTVAPVSWELGFDRGGFRLDGANADEFCLQISAGPDGREMRTVRVSATGRIEAGRDGC